MGRITDHRNPLSVDISCVPDHSSDRTVDHALHICPECGSCLVQATSWEQVEDRSGWRVWRRCPECEWAGQSLHGEDAIDAFDQQLDLGSQELVGELRTMEHANMSELAATFVFALDNDLIGADDFVR
jgi:hypothetical protein